MENKLRLLRLKNNLTQENIAFELGISQKAYSKIENGQVRLTQDKVGKLSKIFNVPNSELCHFCDKSLNNSKLALLLQYLKSKKIPIPDNLK
jgi:transcriptional regulator with XRE-family HTH domain